jgi:nitroimidazol reductase NimA-like FMN-containing flavoprotein (pyridoxamine 5'-phosphate oxidase superfamily)
MEKNPRVCFEMDCAHRMITGEIPCESSMDYASVIGYGLLEKVEDDEEKRRGLALILQNCRMNFPPEMIDRMPLGAVTVLKLCSNDFTAKQRGVAF